MRRFTHFFLLYPLCALLLLLPLSWGASSPAVPNAAAITDDDIVGEMLLLVVGSPSGRAEALQFIEQNWQRGFTPMLLDILSLSRDAAFNAQLIQLMEKKAGQSFSFDMHQWRQWLWQQEPQQHRAYAEFKSALYGLVDEKFEAYFERDRPSLIRLDEVLWGGVAQDGIPPLRHPQMISAGDATYLDDDNLVFGVAINGDMRAYPRRILAWHEMFVDEVGGVPIIGVYCTLCGTMILYKTEVDGVNHALGTSGFLYRSNKLMYDRATQSLWNTIWGKPVIGPLALLDITLERLSVVTTTWAEWRRRHPATRVLSLHTGYNRDYSEGVAYRDYFATDELMFPVPTLDDRLKNKAEILGLVFPRYPQQPLAISADFLARHPVYQDRVEDMRFVVFTDSSGANRVYQAGALKFARWDAENTVEDSQGTTWHLEEARLTASDGRVLHRLPAHRAFWFGWFSAYSNTRLVH